MSDRLDGKYQYNGQKLCPADGSLTRPWTALEAAFAEDGESWGFNTCEAYKDLERRKKAVAEEYRKIDAEWQVMLALEQRARTDREMRQVSESMRNPVKGRVG